MRSKSCEFALWVAPENRRISSAAAARDSCARCSPSISSAPSSWCTGFSSDTSSSRFAGSRKKVSRTCSMVRRLARISETTWFMRSRSCALRDISSSKGISGALRRSLPSMQSSRRERRSCACWANSPERCARPASAFSSSRSAVATSSATASLMFSRFEVSHAETSATFPASAVRSALPSCSASSLSAAALSQNACSDGGLPDANLFQASFAWVRCSRADFSAGFSSIVSPSLSGAGMVWPRW